MLRQLNNRDLIIKRKMEKIKLENILPIIRLAVKEDIGIGDITTDSIIPEQAETSAAIIVEEECVLAGLPMAAMVFEEVDNRIELLPEAEDSDRISVGQTIAHVKGPARGILTAERLALNLLQRLSGIATLTSAFIGRVEDRNIKIMDTRKTTPGLRYLEKYAVRVGGGTNHRFGLFDLFLIKDNHIRIASKLAGTSSITGLIQHARKYNPNIQIEVETETIDQVQEALEAGADIIMFDNMSLNLMHQAVKLVAGRAVTEASGGITLENIAEIATTGVDCASIGALTSAARNISIKLELA